MHTVPRQLFWCTPLNLCNHGIDYHIRNIRDCLYGIWKYKVLDSAKYFSRGENKTWKGAQLYINK